MLLRGLTLAFAGGHHPVARAVLLALLVVAALWLLLARATPAQAAGVVTDCSNDSQLRTLLTAGGAVSFNCNNNHSPATIVVSPAISLGDGVFSLDGGSKVTLSGANTNRIFYANHGGLGALSFTLTHIVLSNGYDAAGGGCLFIYFANQVLLDDVTVQHCRSDAGGQGGGIYHALGNLTLKNSRLLTNTAGTGGGLRSTGPLALHNTRVAGNRALTGSGGGLDLNFSALISNSTIYANTADAQDGGGLRFGSSAVLTVVNSQIHDNHASRSGGGIFHITGTATLNNVTLSGNTVTETNSSGGGIANFFGTLNLSNAALSGNQASGGGGIINLQGTATLTSVTLSGNSASVAGGGLYNVGGTATLNGVTLSGNTATYYGGGMANSLGAATLTNATLSGNMALAAGGGLYNYESTATLTNVTLSGNSSAGSGGGLWHFGLAGQTLTVKNTLLANSPAGGNCRSEPGSVTALTSNNFNLSSDNTCTPYFNKVGDWNNENPILSALGNHGGPSTGSGCCPMLTQVPFPPSKAIDGGAACPSPDQRGVMRPQGLACDIGAVEYVPGEKAPWLWLPFTLR